MANPLTRQFYQVSPTFRLMIYMEQIGQSQKNNTSDVLVQGWMYNDNTQFNIWNQNTNVWRSIEGEAEYKPANFSFNIAPSDRYKFIEHTFTVKHDDITGYKGVDFEVHYGDTGTAESDGPAYVSGHLDLTRIPQSPDPPGSPVFTNIKQTSLTVSWSASPDNHGAKITNYRLRRWNSDHTQYVNSDANNLTRNVTGLKAGATYIFEVRADNSAGTSAYSDEKLVDLSGGIAIRMGGQWTTGEVYIRRPGTHKWVEGTPFVRVGGVWKQAK